MTRTSLARLNPDGSLDAGFEPVALSFDYGQRHSVELQARRTVLDELRRQFPQWAGRLGEDHELDLAVLGQVSETSLTRDMEFQMESSGLPGKLADCELHFTDGPLDGLKLLVGAFQCLGFFLSALLR